MSEKAKSKGNQVAKNIFMIVFILAAVMFVWRNVEHRKVIQQENEAIVLLDDGKYEEARVQFEQLLDRAKSEEARQRHRTNIARCYYGQAEDSTDLPLAEQVKLYRRAADYDPAIIQSPAIKLLLEKNSPEAATE
jgi:predicted negative regulator of RcsB-dependent stress response